MVHVQKPDFVFRRNGRVHLNRLGASVQSTTGSRGVRISGSNAGYTVFRGSVKGTGYPLHSPVSLSLLLPCVTVCHHISTGVYNSNAFATSTLGGRVWVASTTRQGFASHGKNPGFRFGLEGHRIFRPPPGFDPRTTQSEATPNTH